MDHKAGIDYKLLEIDEKRIERLLSLECIPSTINDNAKSELLELLETIRLSGAFGNMENRRSQNTFYELRDTKTDNFLVLLSFIYTDHKIKCLDWFTFSEENYQDIFIKLLFAMLNLTNKTSKIYIRSSVLNEAFDKGINPSIDSVNEQLSPQGFVLAKEGRFLSISKSS